MRNLTRLRFLQFNSRLARRALALYYRDGCVYQIPAGALRGARLRYDSSIEFHTMLGLKDAETIALLNQIFVQSGVLRCDSVVCDIGANIGFYTLWFARAVAPGGIVYAFEPGQYALERLTDHVALNSAANVEVFGWAVSDHCGTAKFYLSRQHHSMSSLDMNWAEAASQDRNCVTVPTTTLDDFFSDHDRSLPHLIKIDIEGGGVWALRKCDRCIDRARPFIVIESHLPAEDQAISDMAIRNDYMAFRLNMSDWVTELTEIYPNPKGVWGTLLLIPKERYNSVAATLPRYAPDT